MQLAFILLCLAFPLLELAVMIKVGQSIGVLWTIALLIGMGLVGGAVLRAQGFAVLRRAIAATRAGEPPIGPVIDSMFLMLAGVLFLIPGFITDVLGGLLLIPPLRQAFARWLLGRMRAAGTFTASSVHVETRGHDDGNAPPRQPSGARPEQRRQQPGGVVIDGEWERVDEPSQPPRGGPSQTP